MASRERLEPAGQVGAPSPAESQPAKVRPGDPGARRRRASRSLWTACEALLSASEPRGLQRALDALTRAFGCDGVALHAVGPDGELQPWCARGQWRSTAGDLRDCLAVPLRRGEELVGSLDLRARAGQVWKPAQLTLIRAAAGALGAALGARLELQRLRNQPGRDSMTGLPDGRAFHARLNDELARARRHGLPLAVLTVDLDHFAALNARHGREAGDVVLADVALVLRLALRESDVLARLGGDQFAVLLPETDLGPGCHCAERLRRILEEHRFSRIGRLTVSIGVASSPRNGLECLELLAAADHALSLAKKGGRRRAVGLSSGPAH